MIAHRMSFSNPAYSVYRPFSGSKILYQTFLCVVSIHLDSPSGILQESMDSRHITLYDKLNIYENPFRLILAILTILLMKIFARVDSPILAKFLTLLFDCMHIFFVMPSYGPTHYVSVLTSLSSCFSLFSSPKILRMASESSIVSAILYTTQSASESNKEETV